MSITTIESKIDHRYLSNRTKDQLIMIIELGLKDNDHLTVLLADLYYTAHREGWEPGESTDEVCERVHNELCNRGCDPYTNGGPERLVAMRKRLGL